MTALRRLLVTCLVVAAIAAGGWYGWRIWDEHASVQATGDAYVKGDITVLSPRVAGYAIAITADDGEAVEAGRVLVRLDPRDYRAAVERAQARVEQERASAEEARQRLDLQGEQIKVAQAGLESAQAQGRNAATVLSRAQDLLGRGAGTQASADNATAAEASARAAIDQARAQFAYQRQQLGVLGADIRVAQTRVDDAEVQLGTARIALEDTAVWAPIAGTIANRRTQVGEYVTVGTRMLSIVPREGLWIEAEFRETQIGGMRAGQPVSITLDTYGGRHLCGYVESIGSASGSEFALVPADNATGNFTRIVRRFPVRIRANARDPDRGLMRPGMSATVAVAVDGEAANGCRFDPSADRQPTALPHLPPHPGLAAAGDPRGGDGR